MLLRKRSEISVVALILFGFLLVPLHSMAAAGLVWKSEARTLQLRSQGSIQVRIVRPEGSGRLPAVLVFGGFEKAADVLDLVHPTEPIVLASFDYPYAGSRQFNFPQTFLDAPALKRTIPATIEGIHLLVALLRARPDVDGDRISIIGASFAAPFVLAAAAQDPNLKSVIIVHGFADLRGTVRHRLEQVWRPKLGVAALPLAWLASGAIAFYLNVPDPEAQARLLQDGQRVLMIEALSDDFIPLESRERLWGALQGSRAHVMRQQMPGGHLMPGAERLIDEIMEKATAWMRNEGAE